MNAGYRNDAPRQSRPAFWRTEFDRIFLHAAAAMPGNGGRRHRSAAGTAG